MTLITPVVVVIDDAICKQKQKQKQDQLCTPIPPSLHLSHSRQRINELFTANPAFNLFSPICVSVPLVISHNNHNNEIDIFCFCGDLSINGALFMRLKQLGFTSLSHLALLQLVPSVEQELNAIDEYRLLKHSHKQIFMNRLQTLPYSILPILFTTMEDACRLYDENSCIHQSQNDHSFTKHISPILRRHQYTSRETLFLLKQHTIQELFVILSTQLHMHCLCQCLQIYHFLHRLC